MTLQQLFQSLGNNPTLIILYFVSIPLVAAIIGFVAKGDGYKNPWKYVYSALIYMVCIPGIFSITLSLYLFLFENRSILQTDVFTQIIPLASMFVTLLIITKNVKLEHVPGFDKLSGLLMAIFAALMFMWILDRTRIFAVTFIPFQYGILIFLGLMIAFRIGMSRLFK